MLQFDQESQPTRRSGALGVSGRASGRARELDQLAREIEETQRQQSETMTGIAERLRAIEVPRADEGRPQDQPRGHDNSDEPWDSDMAEALAQSYEAESRAAAQGPKASPSKGTQDWIGARFSDVTQRIQQAISDLTPTSTVSLLETRLDAFQAHISATLADVVRRSDLDGMREIEAHVHDLGDKLTDLERHVSRLDGIESDVRGVMEQVSDERIAKLLDYDSRFAADLEAVALRAAEHVRSHFDHRDGAEADANTRRHDELRALIEASIEDRRQAEAHAVSMVTGLSGRVGQQSDRYDELKGLIEQAILEQRQSEQTAFGMLETLQQALVTVLDRMDVIEQHQLAAALPVSPLDEPVLRPPTLEEAYHASEPAGLEPAVADDPRYSFRDTRFETFGAKEPADEPADTAQADVEYVVSTDLDSPIERLKRDFVADARRAKLKATANRAEGKDSEAETEAVKPNAVAQARATLTQTSRSQPGAGLVSGRLFGMPTKVLAGVLALIIAINGGLLIYNRSKHAASPPAASQPTSTAPAAPAGSPTDGKAADQRSDLGQAAPSFSAYGYNDDVLDPPEIEGLGNTVADVPLGTTIAKPAGSMPEEAVADVYEQQVLASLSGKLGMIAAGRSADALLPEKSGRIDAAYPDLAAVPGTDGSAGESALDLPPPTVGPLPLRLAAASGDASAEFEVGARLAEGKGTQQNFSEAVKWYQRAAAQGFAQAQYRLGTLYERGLGVKKDIERAKVWYMRAAEKGNVKAMHNLAVLLTSSDAPDYAGAAPWFLTASEFGLADSQYNLGVLLENGLAGGVDRVGAYKWYTLAAKEGDGDAVQRRDALRSGLSADELKAADDLIGAFRAHVASPLANDARAAGEDWKKRASNDSDT
ncbi:MAG: hypothetical protein AB7S70_02370 [Hyphomicrobium sp.]